MYKKLFLGFAAAALAIGAMSLPTESKAATVLQHGNTLGDAIILNRLFSGDKILGGNALGGNNTSLGNLLILDQLFPKTTVAPATTGSAGTVGTTGSARVVTLAERMQGKILLQVENRGQAWYVNPVTDRRISLGNNPAQAFNVMADQAIGISNSEFNSFNGTAPSRFAGRFLIKSQDAGQLYYVNPTDLSINFISSPSGAQALIERFGVGISNANLNRISQ